MSGFLGPPIFVAIHDSVAKSQCEVEVTVRWAVGDVAAHSRHGHDEKPGRREWLVNGWLMVVKMVVKWYIKG